jgi:tetraacyldisaccharide 4'-kinase
MREPAFWWRAASVAAALLAPPAMAYGAIAALRLARSGHRAGVPVVCIGNLTVGGAGKTPLALAVTGMLKAAGETPFLMSRGYGGRLAGPLRVDPARHVAREVGDEPLLLARAAPTIVARDRVKGAKAAIAGGASLIVMDDGFQNPSLQKDFSVLAIDARRGIGNGRVIPAGPLRAPVKAQLDRADALVVVGSAASEPAVAQEARKRRVAVFQASLRPDAAAVRELRGAALAFAGIGDPEKFFATLAQAGITVAVARAFPDHHRFAAAEAKALCETADREGLALVTTEKDMARLQGDAEVAELATRARALPVTLEFDDAAAFERLLREKIAGYKSFPNRSGK